MENDTSILRKKQRPKLNLDELRNKKELMQRQTRFEYVMKKEK